MTPEEETKVKLKCVFEMPCSSEKAKVCFCATLLKQGCSCLVKKCLFHFKNQQLNMTENSHVPETFLHNYLATDASEIKDT